jgi:ribonuclease VapC
VNRLFKEARDADQPLRMSVVNWGEVYHTIAKTEGFSDTERIMERVKLLPLSILDADELVTTSAARLKAAPGLPYGDCFAAAIAIRGGVLVTSDVKDFKKNSRAADTAAARTQGTAKPAVIRDMQHIQSGEMK